MALKNAYSKMPINNIFAAIQKDLATHGARQIIFDYQNDGKVYGLAFVLETKNGVFPIKVPARIEKVASKLKSDGFKYDDEQCYRVAWRNILDWITAQMAIIDIEMVQIEEVFLPYVYDPKDGNTIFDKFSEGKLLLGGPNGN